MEKRRIKAFLGDRNMGVKATLKASLIMIVLLVGMGLIAGTNVCKCDDAYIVMDDFEDYNDRDELRLVWTDGYASVTWGGVYPYHFPITYGSSGSNLNLSSAVGIPTGGTGPVRPTGSEAMVLRYDNDGETYTGLPGDEKWVYPAPYFSEIEKDTVSPDWNSEGIESLSLWFQGHPPSDGGYDVAAWPIYTQFGRGRDIWGRHDEFFFLAHYPLKGAGSIEVQVVDIDNTSPWAKAGIMIREKWAPYSKFAAVYMTPGNGVTFQWRVNEDGPVSFITKPGITVPEYLKLWRTYSGAFIAQHSETGIFWLDVNDTTAPQQPIIAMGTTEDPNIYIGTAVTSHNALETCTATFDTVTIAAYPLPYSYVVGNIGTNDPEQLYVALSDSTKTVVVNHPDPNAVTLTDWQEWNIALTEFSDLGLNLSDVQKVHVGLGDRVTHPDPGGSGALYIDDIRLYKRNPLFVDADAPAGGDGSNWANAYKYLQDALATAEDGDEIHVAEGTYYPDQGGGKISGDRTATFKLKNSVIIKGGYAGWSEPNPNAHDIKLYKTILSGDLNGDDGPDFANNGENCYHVVTGSGTGSSAIMDGFTITAGNANGPTYNDKRGGGIYNYDGSPTIINCIIFKNSGGAGAGMLNDYECSPTIINCAFIGNSAEQDGGGMHNYGLYSQNKQTLINCTFNGNTAGIGGGISNWDGSTPTVTNCILWGNSDSGGYDESAQISECNSITTINYSCVQGWTYSLGGMGNIGDDPKFQDADGPDDILGTEDDDLRLSAGSPCIDAGDNTVVPTSVVVDLDGNPRFYGNGNPQIVDIGVYEFHTSLVAHWRLNEVASNIAYDSSGNGNHGTLYGDPKWQPAGGKIAGALDFDGSDDYVNIVYSPELSLNEFTFSAWVNIAVEPNVFGIFGTRFGGENTFDIKVETAMIHGDIGNGSAWLNTAIDITSTDTGNNGQGGDLAVNTWYMITYVIDNTNQQVRLYIDADLKRTISFSGTPLLMQAGQSMRIGHTGYDTEWMNGLIDDVRIYNYALSGDDIRWLLCDRPPKGDLNLDCKVNFQDFAILVSEWLDCGLMIPELCW